jgi:hypothetical protein
LPDIILIQAVAAGSPFIPTDLKSISDVGNNECADICSLFCLLVSGAVTAKTAVPVMYIFVTFPSGNLAAASVGVAHQQR